MENNIIFLLLYLLSIILKWNIPYITFILASGISRHFFFILAESENDLFFFFFTLGVGVNRIYLRFFFCFERKSLIWNLSYILYPIDARIFFLFKGIKVS